MQQAGLWVQKILKKRAGVSQSVEQQQQAASISEPLRRCLGSVDVLFLGLGSILGAGCFVLTGLAAHDDAGYIVELLPVSNVNGSRLCRGSALQCCVPELYQHLDGTRNSSVNS